MKETFLKIKERWTDYADSHPLSSKAFMVAGLAVAVAATMIVGAPILIPLLSAGGGTWMEMGAALKIAMGLIACASVFSVALPAGGALHLYENKLNKTPETTVNEAGQTVQGPRWALMRLQRAQKAVTRLSAAFNQSAAPADVEKKIEVVIAEAVKARQAVTVLDAGTQGAGKDRYQFARTVQKPGLAG